ncbi:MAG: M3 family oligoendopeptidase, partial [Crocinitomicaceae bacterium]|nr:M3 family oligoendopeptidase [Crocinitomicaceae bacterium]
MKIERPTRKFIDDQLVIKDWSSISPYFEDLLNRTLNSKEDFLLWLYDQSELEAILEEDSAWRYIKMSIDTTSEELSKSYSFFVSEIQPKIAPFEDQLNRKLNDVSYTKELEGDPAYSILFRSVRKSLELYQEKNIPIISAVDEESQKYGAIAAAQSIEFKGEKMTMQKASQLLKETDESIRKEAFLKITERRMQDVDAFDELFDSLLKKRHEIALNAGFKNFRDYKMEALGRFDYSVQDCYDFHTSVKSVIVPIAKRIQEERLALLGKDKFNPWDLEVDPEGKKPLKPFNSGKELLEGTIKMFNEIDPYFGDCIQTMDEMKHLDLESKNGKAPGGYNYPLYEIGVPF